MATLPVSINLHKYMYVHLMFVGGVTGTPTFMINDVVVAADPAWTVSEWNKVVDPLLKKSLGVGIYKL